MAEPPARTRRAEKGLGTLAGELRDLVVAYAKQETVVPLRNLGRFVALGVAGAVLLGIGLVLLVLAFLRALQSETSRFAGDWSWVPYGLSLAACAAVALVAARAITSPKRRAARRGTIA